MLRLEKARKSGEVNVQMRNRDRFFNPVFCTALGIALFMHLFAFVVFHVHAFKIESQWVFPPIRVQSELSAGPKVSDGFVLAEIEDNKLLTPSFQPPPFSAPTMPSISEVVFKGHLEDFNEVTVQSNLFLALEQQIHPLKHSTPEFSYSLDSFKLELSGRLGEKKLIQQPPVERMVFKTKRLGEYKARYIVKIDEMTGKIFWMKNINTSKRLNEMDRKAEMLLAQLYFEHDPNLIETEGEVDITFVMP